VTLKRQYIEKIEWGIIIWLERTTYEFYFSEILKKIVLCIYENRLNGERSIEISISPLSNNMRKILDPLFLP
jgi:hypothetical protein